MQVELEDMLSNVGGRMHNEDLDGDIERCWTALRPNNSINGIR